MTKEELNRVRQILKEGDHLAKRKATPGQRSRGVLPRARVFRDRPGVRTVASRIVREIAQRGRIKLRRQTFQNVNELAGLLQVYRFWRCHSRGMLLPATAPA